jgi:hypothetical protein
METMKSIIIILCFMVTFKTIILEDFSLYHFFKYKKYYLKWYQNRETFQEFMKRDCIDMVRDGDNYKEKYV